MNEHLFEVIEKVVEAKTKKDKVGLLKTNETWALKDLLMGTYNDKIVFNLPGGEPPYTPNVPQSVPSSFLKLHKNLKFFVKGGPGDKMPSYQRESKFIQMLESIHPADAMLVIDMINKKPIKGITKAIATETFPEVFA